jgi:hypothetical protein
VLSRVNFKATDVWWLKGGNEERKRRGQDLREEERRKKEEGRRKKEEVGRKKEEGGRRKKEAGRRRKGRRKERDVLWSFPTILKSGMFETALFLTFSRVSGVISKGASSIARSFE